MRGAITCAMERVFSGLDEWTHKMLSRRALKRTASRCLLAGGVLTAFHANNAACGGVSRESVAFGWAVNRADGRRYVALRSYALDGVAHRLLVDQTTLVTRIAAENEIVFHPISYKDLRAGVDGTPYGQALESARRREGSLRDAGLDHVRVPRQGIDLTVDLCPSHHPLDRRLFVDLMLELGKRDRPVPVAIAVTGVWMQSHPDDLDWLVGLERAGRLSITWINHSYHHRVDPRAPLKRNFLLEPGTSVEREVLDTEAALLARNLTPSVFFRFPGLISSAALVETILGYGLVPIGSDAWLAKGQVAQSGSIVLVHANGNEPLGVRRFMALLRDEREAVRARRWELFDLRQTIEEMESNDRTTGEKRD